MKYYLVFLMGLEFLKSDLFVFESYGNYDVLYVIVFI